MYLLPEPQEMKCLEEKFIVSYDTLITLEVNQSGLLYESAMLLKEEIATTLGLKCPVTVSGKEQVFNTANPFMSQMSKKKQGGIHLAVDKTFSLESYELTIEKDKIQITGDEKGILYGVQTLRQIIMQEGAILPGLQIKDYPALKNRGFYHDVTRGRVPTLAFLKSLVDKLCFYKINQLQLYIEHSFLFQDFSEVWRDDTPLTAEEILELDRYCLKRNIELIPNVSCFGHLYKVLRTKSFSHLCEIPDVSDHPFSFVDRMAQHTLDISNEESFAFVTKMIEEFMPLFTSKHFNIGADETFDLGKEKSKALADEIGVDNMYIRFVKKICEFVVSKGKIPMFWGDIIASFPEAVGQLPKETICLNWGYAPTQSDEEVRKLNEAGAVQYCCPGIGGWNTFINMMKSAYSNISLMCSYAHKYQTAGVLNTDWGDYGHINHPEFSIPGVIYGASLSWNQNSISFEELNKAISIIEYKDKSESLMQIISEMSEKSIFEWRQIVRFKEMHERCDSRIIIEDPVLEVDLTKVPTANAQLKACEENLYGVLKYMDTSTNNIVQAYQIAARGIYLLNMVGEVIWLSREGKLTEEHEKPGNIAVQLETWYHSYKELWRTVSTESELYRISEVIFWYADYLRNL